MQEYLQTSPQRQEAFNWLYQLISPKYIAMVEQHFEPDSDMIAPFKAYIAYRIAVESALLFNDPNEYHYNTYQDIKSQLSSDVTAVIRRSQNPWLRKCFQDGIRFQPGSIEFELRQQIFLDMQKNCAFLRDHILRPELDQLKPSANLSWSIWQIQPWMLVALVGVFLFFGAFIAASSNLLFAWLAISPISINFLISVITADNISSGFAGAAFVIYLSGLTSIKFTATQYALFSSIMLFIPKLIAGYAGGWVDFMGYPYFFSLTAFLGLPVLFLIIWISKVAPVKN